ncbi:MAG TPA: sensor histidine kinase [Polyangiaceae bacterium]
MTRVLDNLVDNAFKYGASHVALAARVAPQGELVIDVADDGNGIPAGYHDKIFERYARLDRDVATNARIGEGLGLTFCRMAMHAHGGSIRAMNREEGGALFQLRFPGAASLG